MPTEAQIKAVYNANQAKIGDRTLDEMRGQIVAFLNDETKQKMMTAYIKRLQIKYKVAPVKPLNAPNLKAADVLFTVGNKTITAGQFEQRARRELYEYQAEIYDAVVAALEGMIQSKLVETEAQKSGIAPGELIAREVTDKMIDFSNEESEKLRDDFRQMLFRKYNAQILIKEPEPVAQNVSTDDDPSRGRADAPVTVVMFSDFQCPACAATHPVLLKVLAGYGDKIRFVVRDFPLTAIHENAFLAAQAAAAANAQGKFFEYAEILYQNQTALDAASLKKYAADSGLNVEQFELDLQSGKFAGEVRRDVAAGKSYGITGTPTIFVNGVKVRALSAKAFRGAIEKALAKTKN
jgi:protein-disulfide isomerase